MESDGEGDESSTISYDADVSLSHYEENKKYTFWGDLDLSSDASDASEIPEEARSSNSIEDLCCGPDEMKHKKQDEFEQSLINFAIQAMVPLQTMDDPHFRNMLEFLGIEESGLEMVSSHDLGRRLDRRFTEHITLLQNLLKPIQWVCTTADIWSEEGRSFMAVTAHWINENLERKSVALACKRIRGSHTSDRIAQILEDINNNFQLSESPSKIVATVTDNGSNFAKAFSVFQVEEGFDGEESEENEFDMEEAWVPIEDDVVALLTLQRCGAHTLALTAGTDVPEAIKKHAALWTLHSEAIEKCNKLWRLCNKSKSAKIMQKFLKKRLSTPTPTRWNSLYDALKDVVNIQEKLQELWRLLELQNPFKAEELLYLEEYVKCAEPVARAIDILQGEKNSYYGWFVPTILALEKQLKKAVLSDLTYGKPIAEAYFSSIKQRFAEFFTYDTCNGLNAAIAALSFPKFKKTWFPRVSPCVQNNLLRQFIKLIGEELIASGNDHMDTEPPLEDFFDFEEDKVEDISKLEVKAKVMMEQYFSDKEKGVEMLHKYPEIKNIFLKYNTPLHSSTQVERLFSYDTLTNMPKSNQLSNEKFKIRVILKANASI